MIFVFAAILGACIGSFCNVLILRMKDGRSLGGRSACMACKTTLEPRDLVPIVSWLALRGKCRRCKASIHIQYPLVELMGALIGVFAVWRGGDVAFTATFLFFLLVIVVFDLRWQLVPTPFVIAGAGVLGLWHAAALGSFVSVFMGVLIAAGFLGVIAWGSRGAWMGEGDPWVGAALGAALGWPLVLVGLFVAFVAGGSVSAVLLLMGKVTRKTALPFVPFLAFGAFFVYAWGDGSLALFSYAFG